MWEIKEDIATFKSGDFSMICKIKILRENGLISINPETIYIDTVKDSSIVARAMRLLGEKIEEIGIDKFLKYTVRHCRFCGELFSPGDAKAKFCSQKCRTAAHRLKEDVKKGKFTDIEETVFEFKNGFIELQLDRVEDEIKYKDTTANIFIFNPDDPEDEDELKLYKSLDIDTVFEDIQYSPDGSDHLVIFNKKGEENNYKLMLIYETFWKDKAR